ncbi:MAG: hypothetical protein IJ215_01785 [Clostridia bacterium]|nr:hypothetical protein [Clostridia bacterium]
MKLIFEIEKDMEEIILMKEIKNNRVYLKNGNEIVILNVEPINFKLKSQAEQNSILESYQYFLKQCDFDIQIFVQTQKADAKKHIKEIEKCILYEPALADMAKDYISFVNEISEVRGSISRKFYIAMKTNENDRENKISKIKEGLESCGNMIKICNNDEIVEIFKVCFKKFLPQIS